ncbi:MAG: DNA (cytosine-5-)-methyltransferase, partial [Treponemataceae bacterium]|nr:DNA (cytosine-5-)-methyltransferase [Treponemataceae bacterium]
MAVINSVNLASVLGISNATVHAWVASRKIVPIKKDERYYYFDTEKLAIPEIAAMEHTDWDCEAETRPIRAYSSIELFAGAGGLALGLQTAGFSPVLLSEIDHDACETLRLNCKGTNIVEGDVRNIDFSPYKERVDFLSGGFPCQAFSYAGKQRGFEDARGTLCFELARAIGEIRPKVFLAENVKGLVSHDKGRTFKTISRIIADLG